MKRRTFLQILNEEQPEVLCDYQELHRLFYKPTTVKQVPLYDFCGRCWGKMPLKIQTIQKSLSEFDKFHNFDFSEKPSHVNLNFLLLFCEYSYNLTYYAMKSSEHDMGKRYLDRVLSVMQKFGYTQKEEDSIFVFVSTTQE